MNANDYQVGGNHYRATVGHWDYTMRCLGGRYLEGQITRYVTRWRKKNGLQDLEKALHYLQKLREVLTEGYVKPALGLVECDHVLLRDFLTCNDLSRYEVIVVTYLTTWGSVSDLAVVETAIKHLVEEAAAK